MVRSRVCWNMIAPFCCVALVAILLVVGYGGRIHRQTLEHALFRRLDAVAAALVARNDLFQDPLETWRAPLEQLAAAENVRISVISGDGTTLADTAAPATRWGNQFELPGIQAAIRSGDAHAQITNGRSFIVVAAVRNTQNAPTDRQREGRPAPAGWVRVASSGNPIQQNTFRWRWGALALASGVGAAGLLWVVIVAARRDRDLTMLTARIESAIKTGQPVSPPTGRSVGKKSVALSNWTATISQKIAVLKSENARLDRDAERRRSILAGMAEGVLAVGRDEVVLLANPAAAAFLEVPEEKLLGRPLWETVRLASIQSAARAALAGEETSNTQIELARSETVLALRARPLPGDEPGGAVLVLHDITELRRLENLRRQFVSNVSHELKTPLAAIQALTETLLAGAIHDSPKNMQFLQRIDEQADRLHHLVVDVLRLARIEAGTDVFTIQRLTAARLITSCVDAHRTLAHSRKIQLQLEPATEEIRLRADADGLRTILDNLLENAIGYTPAGGTVTIGWSAVEQRIRIDITDTGIGIPESHLPRIFERFYRADEDRSRRRGGTGLGLAIVKHLVQAFGGTVEVQSKSGQGSRFTVFLPRETSPYP